MASVDVSGVVGGNPDLRVIRSLTNADSSLPTERQKGVNYAEFDEVVLVGTPLGGATAFDVDVYFWSDAKNGTPNGGFVPALPAISLTFGSGGGRAIVRVAHHKSVWFHVPSITGGTGERVRLEVAGVPVYNRRG